MKALICTEPGNLEYAVAKRPELKKGQAIIKIKRIGICGTDLHAFEGTQPYFTYPRILGHELAGELIEFDNAPGFEVGEAVSFIPYFSCGNCIACRMDKPNCCVNMKVCGVHVDGGMAEYLSVPSSSLVHGEGLNFDELALMEPLAIGAHGVGRAAIASGEFVLVMGAGPIGIATIEFARIAGGTVIVLDVNAQRLKFCNENLKVDYTIDASVTDVADQLKAITDGDMPTVILDATGNLEAINNGFIYMAHGGRYVLIGLQKAGVTIDHPEFHRREGTLMSSRNATRRDFEHAISALKKREINPTSYITHRAVFDDVKEQFGGWLNGGNGVIKAMVEM